jgi:cob(I)alamin adenosyltransferase
MRDIAPAILHLLSIMNDRLTSIITKTGDDGSTGLGDGSRISKNDIRIQAIGDVDELNSQLGLLVSDTSLPGDIAGLLQQVQHRLFDLGAELSVPGYTALNESHVSVLEQAVQTHIADLPPLREFILPGGCAQAAQAHVCRSVCRRAERSVVALNTAEPVSDAARHYLNRLSDCLFVIARVLNQRAKISDIFWQAADKKAAS